MMMPYFQPETKNNKYTTLLNIVRRPRWIVLFLTTFLYLFGESPLRLSVTICASIYALCYLFVLALYRQEEIYGDAQPKT